MHKIEEPVVYNAQYRELVALINYQREKISTQQADLTKVSYTVFLLIRVFHRIFFSMMLKLCIGRGKSERNNCS